MSSMFTPPSSSEQRRKAILDATGQNMTDDVQILNNGLSNEVLSVNTESGESFILRTSIREIARAFYMGERRAIKELTNADIPAPEVIALNAYEDPGGIRYSLVETKLPGITMSEFLKTNPQEELRLAAESGELLRKINSIPVEKFGFLDKRCKWQNETIHEVLNNPWYGYEAMLKLAPELGLDPAVLHKVYRRYHELCAVFPDLDPILLHNDFHTGNIMVLDGHLSAVIDLELAAGGDHIREHARWAMNSTPESTEAFVNAWYGSDKKEKDYELRFETWTIQIPLVTLKWLSTITDDFRFEHIERSKRRLDEIAARL